MFRKTKLVSLLLFVLSVCPAWSREKDELPLKANWVSPPVTVEVARKTYRLGMVKDKDQKYLAATTADGLIVRDSNTLNKIFLVQYVYILSHREINESLRINQLDYEIGRVETTLNMSYLTDAVLFLRDASSRALAEAIVAALSGGSSTGRTIAKAAAISGIKSFLKDPVSYAKGINYLTMQSSLSSLQRAKKNIAEDVRSGNFVYERAKQIHTDIVFGLSRSGTCQVLQGQLYLTSGGGGDLVSQLNKVVETMLDQLIGKVTESFKHKVLIDEAVLGIKITDFLIQNCPAYAKYVRDTKNLEKDFQYETSQYYIQVIEPTIKYWSVTNHQETDKPLSSPEETLRAFYRSLVLLDVESLVKTVSSDGDFDTPEDLTEEFKKADFKNLLSNLKKVAFFKKAIYEGREAILVVEYYPTQIWKLLPDFIRFVEDSKGDLVAVSGHAESLEAFLETCDADWVVRPVIYTFKKEQGTWKVHGTREALEVGRYDAENRTFRDRLEKEAPLNYDFYPVAGTGVVHPRSARPGWILRAEKIKYRDICVLLDTSLSMLAKDVKADPLQVVKGFPPSRLELAKHSIVQLLYKLREIQGRRIALVTFDESVSVRCPLTHDYSRVGEELSNISAASMSQECTVIGNAIREATERVFDSISYRHRDIILLTDGEDHGSSTVEAAVQAAAAGVRIIAIGLGDWVKGSQIPVPGRNGQVTFLEHNGREIWSKLNSSHLRKIAYATRGGAYVRFDPGMGWGFDLGAIYEVLLEREVSLGNHVSWGFSEASETLPAADTPEKLLKAIRVAASKGEDRELLRHFYFSYAADWIAPAYDSSFSGFLYREYFQKYASLARKFIKGIKTEKEEKDFAYSDEAVFLIIREHLHRIKPIPESLLWPFSHKGSEFGWDYTLRRLAHYAPENIKFFEYQGALILMVRIEGEYKLVFWKGMNNILNHDSPLSHFFKCKSNLKELALGFIMYADEHEDKGPSSLADLKEYCDRKAFWCPSGGRKPDRRLTNYVLRKEAAGANRRQLPKQLGQSYSTIAIIWDDPSERRHGNKINIAYADGHIETRIIPETFKSPSSVAKQWPELIQVLEGPFVPQKSKSRSERK